MKIPKDLIKRNKYIDKDNKDQLDYSIGSIDKSTSPNPVRKSEVKAHDFYTKEDERSPVSPT